MKNYLIEISFLHPYPLKTEYRQSAGSFAVSISRAVKEWRKEHKGKRIKEIIIKVIQL